MTSPGDREDNEGKKFDEVNSKIVVKVKILEDDGYTQRMAYTAQGLPEYIGIASPGTATSAASWKIKKLIYTGTNVTSVIWADGDLNFDNIWNNYASLSYS